MAPRIEIRGEHDEATIQQLTRCAEAGDAVAAALCADGHLGYSMPIGGVVAYPEHVSPSGVGYDIACGNKAVLTDLKGSDVDDAFWPKVADEIASRVSFGMGRVNNEPVDHAVIERIRYAPHSGQRGMVELAEKQLGTVGAGNHYVDVFTDQDDNVWVGCHFGSRGFGHKTATNFMAIAQGGKWGDKTSGGEMHSPPILIEAASELGQQYIAAMELAGEYAYAGRDIVCNKVLEILGAKELAFVHNHHNYAWQETVDGVSCWVVRKGATPAHPGSIGFIGSSMGEESVTIIGQGDDALLNSTVHGAGRAMSRTVAAGRYQKGYVNNARDDDNTYPTSTEAVEAARGKVDNPRSKRVRGRTRVGGAIDWEATRADLTSKGIHLRGGAADEAPLAYKRLPEVLAAHEGSIQITNWLTPRVVVMAGPDTIDPFKD